MTEEVKAKLKSIPVTRCSICNSWRSYGNPMARCSVCKKHFCFDHIRTKIEKKGVVDYCDKHFPKE